MQKTLSGTDLSLLSELVMLFKKNIQGKNSVDLLNKKRRSTVLLFFLFFITMFHFNDGLAQQSNSAVNINDSLQFKHLKIYQEVEDEDAYQRSINRADMLFTYGRYKKAKDYYIEALAVYPGDPYARARIKEIDSVLEAQKIDFLFLPTINFEHPSTLVVFLLFIIVYSIASMIILLVIILITRARREYLEKVKEKFSEEYQTLLINYIYETKK